MEQRQTVNGATSVRASVGTEYQRVSCYYCNAWYSENAIQSHVESCGLMLEPCPNGCGEQIARKHLNLHAAQCAGEYGGAESERDGEGSSELATFRSEMLEFANRVDDRLDGLQERFQVVEEFRKNTSAAIRQLVSTVSEEADARCSEVNSCRKDVKYLMRRVHTVDSWRQEFNQRIQTLETTEAGQPNLERSETIEGMLQQQQQDVDELKRSLTSCSTETDELGVKMAAVERQITAKNAQAESKQEALLADQVKELTNKLQMLTVEQRDTSARLFTLEDNHGTVKSALEKYRRETYYTKQRLDDLESNLRQQDKLVLIQNADGLLVWRIDQFDRRFKESQENDIMLKSPLFSNCPFGYTMRLEASLNGFGTWRGRNMLVGLSIIDGLYDPLLEWPCKISGTVTLRDQVEVPQLRLDCCKAIVAKRKRDQYETNQFIYFPHETLFSNSFIRDDTLFLTVCVDSAVAHEAITPVPDSPRSNCV